MDSTTGKLVGSVGSAINGNTALNLNIMSASSAGYTGSLPPTGTGGSAPVGGGASTPPAPTLDPSDASGDVDPDLEALERNLNLAGADDDTIMAILDCLSTQSTDDVCTALIAQYMP